MGTGAILTAAATQAAGVAHAQYASPASEGGYSFAGGFPTTDAAQRAHDDQDFQRAVQAYCFFYPTVSMEATFQGTRDAGVEDNKATMVLACGPRQLPRSIDLEARQRWFSQAVGMSPKMVLRTPGAGSLYWLGLRDKDGAYLDGGKTYRLSVPQPVPQKLFWSVTVYDSKTRSQIQTGQGRAALRSLVELKNVPKTGTTELYFGPSTPSGAERRWIKTNPGQGWFAYFRLYGPDGPAFNGSWKPGDFETVS